MTLTDPKPDKPEMDLVQMPDEHGVLWWVQVSRWAPDKIYEVPGTNCQIYVSDFATPKPDQKEA